MLITTHCIPVPNKFYIHAVLQIESTIIHKNFPRKEDIRLSSLLLTTTTSSDQVQRILRIPMTQVVFRTWPNFKTTEPWNGVLGKRAREGWPEAHLKAGMTSSRCLHKWFIEPSATNMQPSYPNIWQSFPETLAQGFPPWDSLCKWHVSTC